MIEALSDQHMYLSLKYIVSPEITFDPNRVSWW